MTRRAVSRTNCGGWWFGLVYAATLLSACGSASLDAGSDHPHGLLPVDERNPVIVSNDGPHDNWQGEFAMAMASAGDMQLAGIIVNATVNYPSIDSNMQGWRAMAAAARASGMRNIPDPIASIGPVLERPADGNIDETPSNRSEGALLIVDTARRLSQPFRPIVVATGGELTDIADAYLIDHSVVDQLVVVSSLGHTLASIAKIIAGASCVLDTDCCGGPTIHCVSNVCQNLALLPTPATFTRHFTSTCPSGTKVTWALFQWQSITPTGTSIVFQVQTGDSLATLGPAVGIGTAQPPPTSTSSWTDAGQTVDSFLRAASPPQASHDVLHVLMTLNPSGSASPTLTHGECITTAPRAND